MYGKKAGTEKDKNTDEGHDNISLELVSKELNHMATILQHYVGSLIFMK